MIKVSIRTDKLAVVRFNHKEECNRFRDLMLNKKNDLDFPTKIKVKDERR